MSKKLLSAAIIAAIVGSSSVSKAEVFNGMYTGVSAGWFHKRADASFNTPGLKNKHNFNQIPVSVQFGYLQSMPSCFLWGVEAGLGYAFLNKKSNVGTVTSGALTGTSFNLQGQTKFFSDLSAKLGWNFDQFIAYALFGVSGHQIEYKVTSSTATAFSGSKKKFVWGIFPGLGFETKIVDNWTAGLEGKWHFQKTQKFNGLNVKSNTVDLRLRLNYAL